MGGFCSSESGFVNKDHLFGLIEVGDISVLVYATTEVPCSRPVSGTAADEIEKDMDVLESASESRKLEPPCQRCPQSEKFDTDFRRSLA
jgi:hypothetical protein